MSKLLKKSLLILFFLSLVIGHLSPLLSSPKDPNYPLSKAILITKTLSYIEKSYLDPKRIDPDAMFEASLKEIQKTVPEILAKCEKPNFCAVTVKQAIKRFNYPKGDLNALKAGFKDLFPFIEQNLDKDTPKEDVEYSAITGMLDELDPHSNFFSPESYSEFRIGTEGEFGGLGIVISIKDGVLTVTAPIEGTPAWKAGVKPADHILQINDESTINMSLTDAVSKLRGPVGSKVRIKIERTALKEPLTLSMTRAIINIQAVQSKLLTSPEGHPVGFIRVKNFQTHTEQEVKESLEHFAKEAPSLKGVILDLRNNPGGLLDQAIFLSDLFLKEGVIVSTVGKGSEVLDQSKAKNDGFEGNWPLIVLVNEGSASASEIVAGALKNDNRALILGNTTFGKGSIQSIFELPMNAAVKLTVGQYLTPGDKSIQSVGITPDVNLADVIIDKEHLDTIENIRTFEKDLEKHLKQQATELEHPSVQLHFLSPPPKEKEEMEYSTEIKLKNDIAGQLALEMMDVVNSPSRPEMLKEVQGLLQKREKEEEQKIAAKFQTLGVNWETKEAKGHPQAELTYDLLKEGKPITEAVAGSSVTLKIHLKNVGDAPFYRLAAQSNSDAYYFKNIEFAFGEILPGQTKDWEDKIKIPEAHLSEEAAMKLEFKEANGKIPPPVDIVLPVKGAERPHFSHRYTLEENWAQKLKAGKPAALIVTVINDGQGAAKKPLVTIKNLGGKEIFIEKGRASLATLPPGQKGEARFQFHTNPSIDDKEIQLELAIIDPDLIVESSQKITLHLHGAEVIPPQAEWYHPPVITLSKTQTKADKNPFLLEGLAKDDQAIRDVTIFVDENKAYYEASKGKEPQFNFKAELPLKEGNNTVLITARDNLNLISRTLKVIHYENHSRLSNLQK